MRARLALLVVVAASCTAAIVPTSAGAFESYYNCVLKPPNQWCDGRANGSFDGLHSWDWNEAWYPGSSGVAYMCERVWKPSSGGILGSSCYWDWTGHYYGNVQCACYEAEGLQNSGGNHSIEGHADATY